MSDVSGSVDDDEVVVAFHDEVLLIGGDPAAVESYLTRLQTNAGRAMRVAGTHGAPLANAVSRLTGLVSVLANSGKYVQLHPGSLDALRNGNLVPSADGFFRLMTPGNDGFFPRPHFSGDRQASAQKRWCRRR